MDTDRPALTPDDCHALREFSGMTWCVRGRWVSLGEILDSWVDATMRAQYSASARADALAARVAELEAELSATERTADAERERAKRAERLLESESARVAELEAENERLKAWVKATNPWGGECEDPAQTTRSGTGELLAEGRDYQIRTVGTVPEPPSPAPTTRPLTTADRLPQKGDGLRLTTTGWVLSSTDVRAWVDPSGQWVYPEQAVEYEYRADGGLVTVKVTP